MLRPLLLYPACCLCLLIDSTVWSTDFFVTIGGGYNPGGNQASLEANVLFFQKVLSEEHQASRNESIFFADGFDEQADLQFVSPSALPIGPLTDFLKRLHARGGPEVSYRNHAIPGIAGPIAPQPIANSLQRSAGLMQGGDRLIIYATAHGEEADGDNKFNTFISCWDNERFSAKEFAQWLDAIPQEVPVILVMAQCYCGGFARTIFNDAEVNAGLSARMRCGFFAQQHDLPAAGCRPDIENDEEYSSFFWGAFVGRSRNGKPLVDVDCNGDGIISFAEAHAQAVVVSETIDIPLRTSEVLLRQYSRIDRYEHRGLPKPADASQATESLTVENLQAMNGSINALASQATPDVAFIVKQLCNQLSIDLNSDVTRVFEAYTFQQDALQAAQRTASRSRRGRGGGRGEVRAFRTSLEEQWPELADRRRWRDSELLAADQQLEVMGRIEELSAYPGIVEFFDQREGNARRSESAELRDVKFQRLINTLEIIVLEQNLARVATPEIIDRYRAILAVEQSGLRPN